ncbi:gamma-glutamyl-gamma-aminobutyrate hydrolase family protein [Plantibacter sp. CFBP 13570]|uniref:gamma-glutamyl-gamma-aminobutyrate hydrolase family protein n=1 Tax=Plantibacter sp. CFBP 13570 TaxID=2775272 RepID=UPI001930D101|nr:gamma-glutamyl-gamma-aminobutyrate hydrolase family protein [Plantibacter sp. CFBP 13570]MBD8537296.1 gamma-glutamyl-gamma-aminobutyrate hydrolase family protein [Plantibacter sp. CFBP 13570]
MNASDPNVPATDPPVSSAPLIGITTYLEQAQTGVWDVPASFLPKVYLDAVTDAGGIAVLLPPQPVTRAVAASVLARLDGLIVSGGADVDPGLYGQVAHPRTGRPRTDRDAWEEALLTAAIDAELPFLGICRGAQLLNVALGGTLVQHLPDLVGDDSFQPGEGVFGPKTVAIDADSRLAALLRQDDDELDVHVYHHQSIDRVADGLVVTARTEEGVIEAVELPTVPFGLAVQWHPEEEAADRRLFAGLVDAARRHRDAGTTAGRSTSTTPGTESRSTTP